MNFSKVVLTMFKKPASAQHVRQELVYSDSSSSENRTFYSSMYKKQSFGIYGTSQYVLTFFSRSFSFIIFSQFWAKVWCISSLAP